MGVVSDYQLTSPKGHYDFTMKPNRAEEKIVRCFARLEAILFILGRHKEAGCVFNSHFSLRLQCLTIMFLDYLRIADFCIILQAKLSSSVRNVRNGTFTSNQRRMLKITQYAIRFHLPSTDPTTTKSPRNIITFQKAKSCLSTSLMGPHEEASTLYHYQ